RSCNMVQCAALNCSNRPNSTTGVSFFSFPKDKKHSQIWIRNLRRENYHPNSASRLCSEHFEETCFRYRPSLMRSIGYTPKKQILLPGAVPTIFNFKRKEAGKKGGTLQRVDYLTRGRARVIQVCAAIFTLDCIIVIPAPLTISFVLFSRCSDLGDVADSCPSAERKYIVFESCLRTLFAVCVVCSGACDVTMRLIMGTMVAVSSVCKRTDAHTRVWYSQSVHNRMPVGNLMIAAATMFSGCPAAIARNLFQHMGVGTYSLRTYFSLQRCYLIPAIRRLWSAKQQAMLMKRKGIPLRLGGYARCCSPGHSAKYGSYSLMDLSTGEVLTTHLVQCNEVQSRAAMELEGLKRGIGFLQRHGLSVAELTSGRHVQVCKWLRTEMPNIRHRFDVRRVSKVSKKPQCASVGRWARSISNHLCWTAASSGGDADMAVQKWTSVARHICNIHEGHGDIPNVGLLHCVLTGSSAQKELEAVVLSSRLLKDVPQLSPAEETSCLEEFHNVCAARYAKQKHVAHTFVSPGYHSLWFLTSVHFNMSDVFLSSCHLRLRQTTDEACVADASGVP
uniref:THAP-type domain-containing protein n=1 Tax=Kryptolebias marmoratus TaxID=37003 RepID=A0A3Q3B4V4_KRYMA